MKHLFFYGPSGCGKSFAIRSALTEKQIIPRGFCTEKTADGRVYLFGADEQPRFDDAHLVANVGVQPRMTDAAAFDRIGVPLLFDVPSGSVVLMDEVGFLERDAHAFSDVILSLLDRTDIAIIGVCRGPREAAKDTELLRRLRAHENVDAIAVSADMREEMYRMAKEFTATKSGIG